MTHEQIVKELQVLRNLWTWLPDEVKLMILKVGTDVRIIQRQGKVIFGRLGQTKWRLSELEVESDSVEFDYDNGQHYLEHKIIQVQIGNMVAFEFIESREEIESPGANQRQTADEMLISGLQGLGN